MVLFAGVLGMISGLIPGSPSSPNFTVAKIMVNWGHAIGSTTRLSYGLNLFRGHDPVEAGSDSYRKGLAEMAPGLVRYHSWEAMGDSKSTPQGWIDVAHRRWDAEKILAALACLPAAQPDVIVNIPSWPDWMDPNHHGVPDNPNDFATWCADLARILQKSPRRVKYLEITNEKDSAFYVDLRTNGGWGPPKDPAKPDRIAELARLYNSAAEAVKEADPTIRVGGPAAARADLLGFADKFVDLTKDHLDFYSAHAYASGSAADSDQAIMTRADQMVESAHNLEIEVQKRAGRFIPLFFDEFNISWTWETRDPRMANNLGAVFDALILVGAAKNGINGTAAWNERDGIYGKMDNAGTLRPSALLYETLNRFGVGKIVQSQSSDPGIETFAVDGAQGRALWLINRTGDFKDVMGLEGRGCSLISCLGLLKLAELERLPPYSIAFFAPANVGVGQSSRLSFVTHL